MQIVWWNKLKERKRNAKIRESLQLEAVGLVIRKVN